MGGFEIDVEDPRRDDVSQLLEQHRLFAGGVMPPDGVHVLDPEDLGPDVTFFGLRVDGELLGIGALKQLDADHAELKSMHTAAAARGRGVGRALVDHLVAVAAAPAFAASAWSAEPARRSCPPDRCTRRRARPVRALRRVQGDPGQRVHDAPPRLGRPPRYGAQSEPR